MAGPVSSPDAVSRRNGLPAGGRADGAVKELPLFDAKELLAVPSWLGRRFLLSFVPIRWQISLARGYGWLAARLWARPARTQRDIELVAGGRFTAKERRRIAMSHEVDLARIRQRGRVLNPDGICLPSGVAPIVGSCDVQRAGVREGRGSRQGDPPRVARTGDHVDMISPSVGNGDVGKNRCFGLVDRPGGIPDRASGDDDRP